MSDIESLEIRRKRVLYRAQHRGTQEMDILIDGYVADHFNTLDAALLDRLEVLMDEEETDLQAWIMGQRGIPARIDIALIDIIRDHKLKKAGA